MVFSNLCLFQNLRYMADLLVRVRVWTYVSEVIGTRFKKVRNGHRFENFKKGRRSEIQMSVM